MGTAFVAKSKSLQAWGGDVGLGRNLFKLGYTAGDNAADALSGGLAGAQDWQVLASRPTALDSEESLLERARIKLKLIDPTYYPRLKGEAGIVKIGLDTVENAMRIRQALESGREPDQIKVKPADIARYLLDNTAG